MAHYLNVPFATGEKNAVGLGIAPFLAGDFVKMLIAGLVTPAVWAAVSERD